MEKLMEIEDVAKVAHEVNRAYCIAIGDNTMLPWELAPDWMKYSAIDGVVFHLRNPGAGPSQSHENWLALKEKEGWQYGVVKDGERKLHPCMVPFEKLPVEQQAKDYLFRQVVHSLREHTRFWEDM